MACKICGRGACAAYMHSISDIERMEAREEMSDNVDVLRREIQDLKDTVRELEDELRNVDRH